MAQIQAMWGKLNPNERLAGYGAIVLVVVAIIGFVLRWNDGPTLALIAGILALGVLYLKYAPNMNISWPLPPATILLGIGAVGGILLVLNTLRYLEWLIGVDAIVLIGLPLGAALVAWGGWQEYQAAAKPAEPASAPPTSAPPTSGPPAS